MILAAWFLGMWGAAGCALMDVALVDAFLTRAQFRFSTGNASQELRLAIFRTGHVASGLVGEEAGAARSELAEPGVEERLERAESERRLAEERALASEQLRYRDDVLQIALQASGMGFGSGTLKRKSSIVPTPSTGWWVASRVHSARNRSMVRNIVHPGRCARD